MSTVSRSGAGDLVMVWGGRLDRNCPRYFRDVYVSDEFQAYCDLLKEQDSHMMHRSSVWRCASRPREGDSATVRHVA